MSITKLSSACLIGSALLAAAPALAQDRSQKVVLAAPAGLTAENFEKVLSPSFSEKTNFSIEVYQPQVPETAIAQANGNPDFDASYVADYGAVRLSNMGLLETFDPDEIPGIRNIPEEYWLKDKEGKLIGMPIYFGLYGIAYSESVAKASDFPSWKSLLDPKWKGQVSISRPSFVAAYDIPMFARLNGGDEVNQEPGFEFLRQLKPNILNNYSSMSSLLTSLGRGEVAAAPFYMGQVAKLRVSGVEGVNAVIPEEGGIIQPYLFVIPKGAPNIEGAKALLNASVEPEYQLEYAKAQVQFPMNPKVELPEELAQSLGADSVADAQANNLNLDWQTIGTNLAETTRQIELILQQ